MENNNSAVNFSYLLLEYYKDLNLSNDEVIVLMMMDYMINNGNKFVTRDLLSLKMNLDIKAIDASLNNLYKKKYIEIDVVNKLTSLAPIKKILFSRFEKTLLSEYENKQNEELLSLKSEIIEIFNEYFGRELSPIEEEHVKNWLLEKINKEDIINSLKDAKKLNKLSIPEIENILRLKINHD